MYCGCCFRCRCGVVVAAVVVVAVVAIISMAVFVWRGCVLYACDCGCSAIDKSVVIAVVVGGRRRTSRSCSSASSPAWYGVGTCAGATAAAKPSMASQRAQSSSSCDGQMRLRSAPMVTWGADSIWAGLRSYSVTRAVPTGEAVGAVRHVVVGAVMCGANHPRQSHTQSQH